MKSVFALRFCLTGGDRQQGQVVITQYRHHAFAQSVQQPQDFRRMRSTIDQITHEPQHVGGGVESQQVEQAPQGIVTTLNVANGVDGHFKVLSVTEGGESVSPRTAIVRSLHPPASREWRTGFLISRC